MESSEVTSILEKMEPRWRQRERDMTRDLLDTYVRRKDLESLVEPTVHDLPNGLTARFAVLPGHRERYQAEKPKHSARVEGVRSDPKLWTEERRFIEGRGWFPNLVRHPARKPILPQPGRPIPKYPRGPTVRVSGTDDPSAPAPWLASDAHDFSTYGSPLSAEIKRNFQQPPVMFATPSREDVIRSAEAGPTEADRRRMVERQWALADARKQQSSFTHGPLAPLNRAALISSFATPGVKGTGSAEALRAAGALSRGAAVAGRRLPGSEPVPVWYDREQIRPGIYSERMSKQREMLHERETFAGRAPPPLSPEDRPAPTLPSPRTVGEAQAWDRERWQRQYPELFQPEFRFPGVLSARTYVGKDREWPIQLMREVYRGFHAGQASEPDAPKVAFHEGWQQNPFSTGYMLGRLSQKVPFDLRLGNPSQPNPPLGFATVETSPKTIEVWPDVISSREKILDTLLHEGTHIATMPEMRSWTTELHNLATMNLGSGRSIVNPITRMRDPYGASHLRFEDPRYVSGRPEEAMAYTVASILTGLPRYLLEPISVREAYGGETPAAKYGLRALEAHPLSHAVEPAARKKDR